MTDEQFFMKRAIKLAKIATGHTSPNPLVGAVLVKDGKIIGEGYHHKAGLLHAEREALQDCENRHENPAGATLFVTLEPCCHTGRQPPCTQAIINSKIARVVIGSRDPNPLVSGKGVAFLKQNGIIVEQDFLKTECDDLNPIFFHFITTHEPYVALKLAQTIDGRIATKTGMSKWITGEKARLYSHILRNKYSAILCGVGTILADDPLLTCRLPPRFHPQNPTRVIMDTNLRTPPESNVAKTAATIPTIIAYSTDTNGAAYSLASTGAKLLKLPADKSGKVDFPSLLKALGQQNIDSILIEGGAAVNYTAISSNLVDYVYQFVAPLTFGGAAKNSVMGEGFSQISQSPVFCFKKMRKLGQDVLLEWTSREEQS